MTRLALVALLVGSSGAMAQEGGTRTTGLWRSSLAAHVGMGRADWGTNAALAEVMAAYGLSRASEDLGLGVRAGLDLQLTGRLSSTIPSEEGHSPIAALEALATGRFSLGPVGLGAAVRLRDFGNMNASVQDLGFGPSLAVAFVDTSSTRVRLSANWLPLGAGDLRSRPSAAIDPTHLIGDLELSWSALSFHLTGGTFTRQERCDGSCGMFWQAPARLSWQLGVAVGLVRTSSAR